MPDRQPRDRLIDRTMAGDADALSALFIAHATQVYHTAYALTLSADDADDVVQDVFIGLPEALKHYSKRDAFAAWLRRVAVRTTLMRLRAARVRQAFVGAAEVTVSAPTEQELLPARLSLEKALLALAPDQRTAFVLKVVEGYSHAEIAVLLGVRRGTVEVRVFRAIRRLRQLLKEA